MMHEKHTNPTTDVMCAYHIPEALYLSDSVVGFVVEVCWLIGLCCCDYLFGFQQSVDYELAG